MSVCVCLCIKTAKRRITQTAPRDSPKFVRGRPSFPWNLRSKWPTPFQTAQFRPIFFHSDSTVRASEKSSVSANRKSNTRIPTSHRWTAYVTPISPKRWHTTRFCYFFQWISTSVEKVCCKVSSCENFQQQVVATSLLYLTVHSWIAGDVPIYLKIALQVPSSCVSLSVCPSHGHRYCTKTAKRSFTKTMSCDGTGTLVYWRQRSRRNSNWVIPKVAPNQDRVC